MALINWQPSSRLGPSQNVSYAAAGGASAESTAFGGQTYQIRVCASSAAAAATGDGVRIEIGAAAADAGATDTLLPLNTVEYLTVTPGQTISVLSNNASTGTLNVTEII